MAANGNERCKDEGESELAPFDQNLLISLDLSQLRQIVISLVSRLLTEVLEVRILVPTKKSVNIEIAAFTESRPAAFPSRARRTSSPRGRAKSRFTSLHLRTTHL